MLGEAATNIFVTLGRYALDLNLTAIKEDFEAFDHFDTQQHFFFFTNFSVLSDHSGRTAHLPLNIPLIYRASLHFIGEKDPANHVENLCVSRIF